jgi:hypothetical protein
MPASRIVAGLVAAAHRRQGREVATGGWAELVDRTGHRFTDATAQGDTTRRSGSGTAHANQLGRQRLDEPGRHPAAVPVVNFVDME